MLKSQIIIRPFSLEKKKTLTLELVVIWKPKREWMEWELVDEEEIGNQDYVFFLNPQFH